MGLKAPLPRMSVKSASRNSGEMTDRHQPGAKDHGAALTEHVIRKPASKEGGQINKPGIETINLRCEGLPERAEHARRALRRAR